MMNRYENDFDWLSGRPEHSARELLEWCAGISDRAAAKLQRLQFAEAEAKTKARDDRELLEFVAAITGKPEHERQLRELIEKEAEEREARRREEPFHERYVADVTEWNPDQPRVPEGSPQGGQWTKGGGGESGRGETRSSDQPPVSFASYSGPKHVVVQQVAARSVGHHWNPVSAITDESIRPYLSDDAAAYAAGSYSGATDPDHGFKTYGGITHGDYNKEIKNELRKFIKDNRIKKMTKEQMAEFIDLIKSGRGANGKPNGVIGKFNGAIKSMVPKGSSAPTKMDDILVAGRKYMKTQRFRLLAAAAVLSGFLSDAVAAQVQSLDVMSDSGHYKRAIKALQDGDLDRAHRLLTGDADSLYMEILHKVGPHAALTFKHDMDKEFDRARTREYK